MSNRSVGTSERGMVEQAREPGRVCVVGSLNIDTTLRVPDLPGRGETVLATSSSASPGGKGANQAVAAAALGSRVRFIGAVGEDDNAETGLAALAGRGIDISGIYRCTDGTPTGAATVVVGDDSENLIVVDPGANGALQPRWVTEALGECGDEVLLAQLEIPVPALLAAVQAHPALVVLNPAPVHDPAAPVPLFPHVDVLVPNRAELGQLVGRPAPTTLKEVSRCAAALDFGGDLVVTLGSDGAVVVAPNRGVVEHVSAPAVQARDTSGAGDAFCGVLVHELARPGGELVAAVRRAVALAATSTLHPGAQVPPSFGSESVE